MCLSHGPLRNTGEAAPVSKLHSELQRPWRQLRNFFFVAHVAERDVSVPSVFGLLAVLGTDAAADGKGTSAQDESSELKAGNSNCYFFVNISINLTPRSQATVTQAFIHLVFLM